MCGGLGVANTCIVLCSRLPREHAGSLNVGFHVRQHELNGLMLMERLSEGLPFVGVLKSVLIGSTGETRCVSSDVGAAHVEGFHGVHPTARF